MSTLDLKGTELLKRTLQSKAKIIVHRGGSSSSKTYSLAQFCIIKAMTERNIIISVYRNSMPALKKSFFTDFERII